MWIFFLATRNKNKKKCSAVEIASQYRCHRAGICFFVLLSFGYAFASCCVLALKVWAAELCVATFFIHSTRKLSKAFLAFFCFDAFFIFDWSVKNIERC
jgi:hypothetical protein